MVDLLLAEMLVVSCDQLRSGSPGSIWRTPDSDRRAPLRPVEISFSQGDEWKALISRYLGTIPFSGDAAPQSMSCGPPRTPVRKAMIAKVGAAARHAQSAAPRAAGA